VLELRPQMEKLHGESGFTPVTGQLSGGTSRMQVLEALTTLGYGQAEAAAAVRALPDDATGTVEELIMQALRSLARD
jgi:Holliday junction resolvasome RuvABC DNA-binding subunit